MKLINALLLITMVSFFGTVNTATASSQNSPVFVVYSFWGTQQSPILAYPGASDLPLTVQITYLGPLTLYDVNITYSPAFPLSSIPGQGNLTVFLPELNPGQELNLAGFFNISEQAKNMVYNQTIKISYKILVQVPQLGEEFLSENENVSFKVPIIGSYNIKLSGFKTVPIALYSGMYAGGITVYLTNNGNIIAKSINVTATFEKPLEPLNPSSNTVFISYLPPGNVVNFTFPFVINYQTQTPTAINATVVLNIKTPVNSYNISMPVQVKPAAYFHLSGSSYARMTPGATDEYVNINITNIGGYDAKFVTVTLLYNPVFSPYSPSSENPIIGASSINETFYSIAEGQTFTVSYVVNVASGIKPSTYYLPLLISWRQPPTMQTMYQVIDVPINVTSFTLFDGFQGDILYITAGIVLLVLIIMAVYGVRRK
jgi:hypothetical protein